MPVVSTAILLCNLGTPDAPTPAALRRWLAQFLSDRRVVEIPRLLWLPLLHGVILQTRPKRSAERYQAIWQPDGSPLARWTEKQAVMLRGWLGETGVQVAVLPAMRYGAPAIGAQLQALGQQGVQRVLVLPLYPQYSGTTTASVVDAVLDWAHGQRRIPELRFVADFHNDAGYITALADSVHAHWRGAGDRAEKLVMSFHGIPERNVAQGDPYAKQCQTTARQLATVLGLAQQDYLVTFQSRFGRAKWLGPYTQQTLETLARQGVRRVDVLCPGFPCDCLETLEEINIEVRQAFMQAGGEEFRYIPCLNDSRVWIGALSRIAKQHLAGWVSHNDTGKA